MNWWSVLLLLALVGIGVGLFGPYLLPSEDQRALQRLNEVLQIWAGVQDLEARLTIRRPGEPALKIRLLYLSGLALRLEIEEPEGLAGEVYALRTISEGLLLVHYRPKLALGLEARFPSEELAALIFEGNPSSTIKVSWPKEDVLRLRGLSAPFSQADLYLAGEFQLPHRIVATSPDGVITELEVEELQVNRGLELRDLLLLEPLPTRWIQIPVPQDGA